MEKIKKAPSAKRLELRNKLMELVKEGRLCEEYGQSRAERYGVKANHYPIAFVWHIYNIRCRSCGEVYSSPDIAPMVEAVSEHKSSNKYQVSSSEFHSIELKNLPHKEEIHNTTCNGCFRCKEYKHVGE